MRDDQINVRITERERDLWQVSSEVLGHDSTADLIRSAVLFYVTAQLSSLNPEKFRLIVERVQEMKETPYKGAK